MQNCKVLLIDNDVSFKGSVIKSLRDIYDSVKVIGSLNEVGKILKKFEFEVIVYNTAIDENGGFDTLRLLSSYNFHPSIIAYSKAPTINSVIEILKNGVFDFLVAPFSFDRLVESINNGIENRKSFLEIMSLNKSLVDNQQTLEREKEDLKKRNAELQTLTNITKAMTGLLDLNEILHEIIYGIYNVFLFDRIFVSLIDQERGVEEVKVAMGLQDNLYDETIKELSWDINDNENNPWMHKLIREKELVKVENPLENKEYANSKIVKYHPTTFVKIPLVAKDNVIGTLTFDNPISRKPISDDDIKTLRIFADHAGIAIEKARLYENLRTTHNQLKEMQKKVIETERIMAINEVAVSVNHEINNPLCSISLSIEILKMELKEDDVAIKEKLLMMERDIDRIKNITSQLTKIQNVVTTEYMPEIKMIDIKHSSYLEK